MARIRALAECASVDCEATHEYWAYLRVETETDHDTFGSRERTVIEVSTPEVEGWSRDPYSAEVLFCPECTRKRNEIRARLRRPRK